MDPRYKSRFNDAVLAEAARRFGAQPGGLAALDGFESFIYEFDLKTGGANALPAILRVGHSNRRPEPLVLGEAEWINYLHAGGCPVARALPSQAGRLVEAIDDGQGEQFIVTAFEKAPGRHARHADITPGIVEAWGALLGRIHALSVRYQPRYPRPHFDDPIMLSVESALPPSESGVLARYHELRGVLADLPRGDPTAYGMIHQDAHAGNFFIDPAAGAITLFDFDDCCYSWYANDIAIVFFYASMGVEPAQFKTFFAEPFLRGYRSAFSISPDWLATIPHFLKLREIDLYAAIHRSFDVTHLDDEPWVKGYMSGRKEKIEAGLPYLEPEYLP